MIPTKQDAWRGDDAKKMKLKDGMVEPSADFLIRVASTLGVQLRELYAGPDDSSGVKMYSVRYNAYLLMPNGAMLSAENEGKDQCMFTDNGMQAHIIENTRKKAKRNAIKALLGLPTTMLETDFDRPWIALRPVFTPGVSDETDAIIADQDRLNQESRAKLYADSASQTPQPVTDLTALKDELNRITNIEALEVFGKKLALVPMTSADTAEMRALFKGRRRFVQGDGVFDPADVPAAEQTVDVKAEQPAPQAQAQAEVQY